MDQEKIKAVIYGVIVTKIAYFIPILHVGAPILGGAVTAFIINRGPIGGLKAGFIKGIAMAFPAIILGIFFTDMLASIPIIGSILAGSIIIIVAVIVIHSVTLGMVGGFISGGIAQVVRTKSVEDTAKTTANAANKATKATETASNTVDNAKQTYKEERETRSEDEDKIDSDIEETDNSSGSDESESKETSYSSDDVSDQSVASINSEESDLTDKAINKICKQCSATVSKDVNFCPECGAESPTDPEPKQTAVHNRQNAPIAETSRSSEPSDDYTHPTATAAKAIIDQSSPNSEPASRLCQVLADQADSGRVESALRDVVEIVEDTSAVSEAVKNLDNSSTTQQLKSAERKISQCPGEITKSLLPIIEQTVDLKTKLEQSEDEADQYREAAEAVCNAASHNEAVTFQNNGVEAQAKELTDAIQSGEIVFESPGSQLDSAINQLNRSIQPKTKQSQKLLSSLEEPSQSDITEVLQSTVESLNEYEQLQTALADIKTEDVRHQLDSLDADLQQKDEPVYRHLADRVRELEAMVDRENVDDIQLYAIYQESRFYDRTLIPRLSRTTSSQEPLDVDEQIDGIESRIDAIRTEYVNVRADHNHTIPNHFLELADSLCSRARQLEERQPQQAAGVLAAAAELLGHIEQLYERNEYSVMLRRLRG